MKIVSLNLQDGRGIVTVAVSDVLAADRLEDYMKDSKAALEAKPQGALVAFDAGILNTFGGGDRDWWLDYIRNLLSEAHAHYQEQVNAAPTPPTHPHHAEAAADEIVSRLYRRFKDWSKRGFGPEDVTWCEVKADVIALMREPTPPAPEVEPVAWVNERDLAGLKDDALGHIFFAANRELPSKPIPLTLGRSANDGLRKVLQNLLTYAERNTCYHEETHRGGAIWEICDSCGAKWADDEGGKPEFTEPEEIKAARAILDKIK